MLGGVQGGFASLRRRTGTAEASTKCVNFAFIARTGGTISYRLFHPVLRSKGSATGVTLARPVRQLSPGAGGGDGILRSRSMTRIESTHSGRRHTETGRNRSPVSHQAHPTNRAGGSDRLPRCAARFARKHCRPSNQRSRYLRSASP